MKPASSAFARKSARTSAAVSVSAVAAAEAGSGCQPPAGTTVTATDKANQRVARLGRDTAWLLVSAGALGVVLPGVIGTPLLVLGVAVLWPANGQRIERWLERRSPGLFNSGLKQVNRFLDDLERRYPKR